MAQMVQFAVFAILLVGCYAASTTGWTSASNFNGATVPSPQFGQVVAVDTTGNYWFAGTFTNGVLKFSSSLTATGQDIFVAKYSASGAGLVALKFDGTTTASSGVTGIDTDSSNNVWIYGYYTDSLTIGTTTLLSPSHSSLFVVKLSSTGSILLVLGSTSSNDVWTRELQVDSSNNVYIVGSYIGTLSLGSTSLPSTSYNDGYIIKISSTGTVSGSQVTSGTGSRSSLISALDITSTGIFVVGRFSSNIKLGSTSLTVPTTGFFVGSLSTSLSWLGGATGTFVGGTSQYAEGNDIAVDGSNNVFVTGRFQTNGGTLTLGSSSVSSLGYDLFVAQLTTGMVITSGNQAFTNDGGGMSLAKDNNGAVWNSGRIKGPGVNFSGSLVNAYFYNQYLVKVNTGCVFSSLTYSTNSTKNGQDVIPYDIDIGTNNVIITVGDVLGGTNFGSKKISPSSQSVYIATYGI